MLQAMIKIMEEKIDKLIVKAVLEENAGKKENALVECIQFGCSISALVSKAASGLILS